MDGLASSRQEYRFSARTCIHSAGVGRKTCADQSHSSQITRIEPREGASTPMTLITKRRLASLASASAIIATMAVAAVPAAAFAAATCTPTGFIRDGIDLTAAQIGGTVTGELDATGCDIGVYNPTSVSGATSTARGTSASSSMACRRQRDQQQGPPDRRATRSTARSTAAPSSISTARAARSAATRSTTSRRTGSRSAA